MVFYKISELKNFAKLKEKTCARVSLLIKLWAGGQQIKKETSMLMFSCEFCEVDKNTYFAEHL